MTDPEPPDLIRLRKGLQRLVAFIVVVVAFLLWLTFHLYGEWTRGIQVTP